MEHEAVLGQFLSFAYCPRERTVYRGIWLRNPFFCFKTPPPQIFCIDVVTVDTSYFQEIIPAFNDPTTYKYLGTKPVGTLPPVFFCVVYLVWKY